MDDLTIREMPEPVLQKNSLLVQLKAVSVNPVDWKTRQGALKLIQGSKFPRIIGSDFVGIVKEVAPLEKSNFSLLPM